MPKPAQRGVATSQWLALYEQDRPLDDGQRSQLEKQAAQYEERLKKDDKDAAALEGGGSTYAVLGSYDKAVALLTRLTQTQPEESSSWRLLVSLIPLCIEGVSSHN